MMRKEMPAESPEAYVAALSGWRRDIVEALRAATRAAGDAEARIKWGHIVCFSNGPVLLIRAEEARVLFGFWRGKRLLGIEPRLKAGGKYELATMEYREGDTVDIALAEKLVREAVRLNAEIGDPTKSS
ncbi:DUF1801 domain-containing protein [Aminobacter anthyllidis]|uniref:DUF1801 domain-containing protein n=1 Tax=Aminobacter anthyllidis TaxID=1035067 RepID=A0A9X1D4R1_9HYPH|nr:DUF1801 domain-containing protein [Aminobacter anthyllidis]MBT1156392.1 DUF1801 domain-containing protein [Aminobacter anthyllidis]